MPWVPELFSAPALARLENERRRDAPRSVPFFAGLITGEIDALIDSFSGEPEVHHPVRGRIKGDRALEAYMTDTNAWLDASNASVEEVQRVITETRGFEEVVVHLDGAGGRVELPVAIVADHRTGGRLDEMRVYYSSRPLTGRHANRPPVLQADPELRAPDVVADHQRALAAGDLDAIVSAFEPEGYAREPGDGGTVHRGPDGLRTYYERVFSNDGGVPLQRCVLVDKGPACALEYNVVRWGKTELPPQAGVAVYMRGDSGKLAAARMYDDAEPPV
jgi:SnoaL-like domain